VLSFGLVPLFRVLQVRFGEAKSLAQIGLESGELLLWRRFGVRYTLHGAMIAQRARTHNLVVCLLQEMGD